jgi:hypothetical protein
MRWWFTSHYHLPLSLIPYHIAEGPAGRAVQQRPEARRHMQARARTPGRSGLPKAVGNAKHCGGAAVLPQAPGIPMQSEPANSAAAGVCLRNLRGVGTLTGRLISVAHSASATIESGASKHEFTRPCRRQGRPAVS